MRVEFEFLDADDDRPTRVNDEKMIYEGTPPLPSVGETIGFEGYAWNVIKREISYFRPSLKGQAPNWGLDDVDIKVSVWCEGPYDPLRRTRLSREEWLEQIQAKKGKG